MYIFKLGKICLYIHSTLLDFEYCDAFITRTLSIWANLTSETPLLVLLELEVVEKDLAIHNQSYCLHFCSCPFLGSVPFGDYCGYASHRPLQLLSCQPSLKCQPLGPGSFSGSQEKDFCILWPTCTHNFLKSTVKDPNDMLLPCFVSTFFYFLLNLVLFFSKIHIL